MMFLVEFDTAGDALQQWQLKAGSCYSLGRNASSSIVLPHISMSRQHAILQPIKLDKKPFLEIRDLGAVNGTYINGVKLRGSTSCCVDSKAELSFGENPKKYRLVSSDEIAKGPGVQRPRSCTPPPEGNRSQSAETNDRQDDIKRVTVSKHAISSSKALLPGSPSSKEAGSVQEDDYRHKAVNTHAGSNSKCTETPSAEEVPSRSRRSRWTKRSPSPSPVVPNLFHSIEKAKSDGGAQLDVDLSQIIAGIDAAKKKREEEKQKVIEKKAVSAALSNAANPGGSGLSVYEKRRLLWGKKRPPTDEAQIDTQEAHSTNDFDSTDPNSYAHSFGTDTTKKSKFLKLMGHRGDSSAVQVSVDSQVAAVEPHLDPQHTQRINSQLELQYYQGIRRKDGRKAGLGM